ncbi:MAG TPA: DEAD/DEAH box helicase family protein [Terriglobales bacterium]|nr:DEAD/DEAH box helicase family protein [Terriglobales bacterium]
MNRTVQTIEQRLSLRPPQRESLEILSRICELLPLEKGGNQEEALAAVRGPFPSVADFERDFPSVCFALATGVGKTRLMGAFISYLVLQEDLRDFLILAPGLTIYRKLIADFSPASPKYVLRGIGAFATEPPEIITGDNYEGGRGVRERDLYGESAVHVNIFNIGKISAEVRGGRSPRIRRLQESIGKAYFDYLAERDLVLLMDESHRYRASAGLRAINELRPILGLELTATPQTEAGGRTAPFKNVIYSYPLTSALQDGFVKQPAVATRENFLRANYDDAALERLKLEDGVRIHEHTKVRLEIYARETGAPLVKPFMLVVAQNTAHAGELVELIRDPSFFDGRYKDRVITVHSNQSGEERDETVEQLLRVEDADNPVEIVVHVNMLKEGWDVTNLYTIVPLRAASSRTLVEQSVGRGLRLPYGQRTGDADVDRLTIVAHDRFQEIIDEANRPDSIIRSGVIIGRDIPAAAESLHVLRPVVDAAVEGTPGDGQMPAQAPLFADPQERRVASAVLDAIRDFERLPSSAGLRAPEVQQQIAAQVEWRLRPRQGVIDGVPAGPDLASIVARTTELYVERTIDIPRIVVQPSGEADAVHRDFDLDCSGIRLLPVAKEILLQHLADPTRTLLHSGDGLVPAQRPEDYIVRGLMNFSDVDYGKTADLLYKLAGQAVAHLRGYLTAPEDVENVLQYHQRTLCELVHAQLDAHYEERAAEFEAHASKGFMTLRPSACSMAAGERPRNFRLPVEQRLLIRGMVFGGFGKCLYLEQKFQADGERRFAVLLEDDPEVLKWFRPAADVVRIYYSRDDAYVPDFVAETASSKWICEVKRESEMGDAEVIAKAAAARLWCERATKEFPAKPWRYLIVPDTRVQASMSLRGLAAAGASAR